MMLFFPVNVGGASSAPTTPGVEMTGENIVREALLELGVLSPAQDLGAEDGEYGLSKLNRLFDRWNARQAASYRTAYVGYTLTPDLSPHTIGPTGTFEVADRPAKIDAAFYIQSGVRTEIRVRDEKWYQGLSQRDTTAAQPTHVFYDPAVPNGKLWFYPVPSSAVEIELWTRGTLPALELTSQIVAPAGYRDAVIKSLAEELVAPYRVQMPEGLPQQARAARALIFANNLKIPPLDTGMHGCGIWNYRTREFDL
jgi:hypothetical protein